MENTKKRPLSAARVAVGVVLAVCVAAAVFALSGGRRQSAAISFADTEFGQVNCVRVQSMHSGEYVWIEKPEEIEKILAFLGGVKGTNRESGKGYYEGSYEVCCFKERTGETLFSIGFGDSPAFYYGTHDRDAGYPNRYTLDGMGIEEITEFFGNYLPLNHMEMEERLLYVNGTLYHGTKETGPMGDSGCVRGAIRSSVPAGELPDEEGESNFGCVGESYTNDYDADGWLMVSIGEAWYVFRK
ncbi:MAG: hypothetical protein Q4F28_03135 [Eubacteriales bacterium]|nr:hypothetical protein [Eubacteriales bacterium]